MGGQQCLSWLAWRRTGFFVVSPRPGIAEPERREQMDRGRFRTAVMNGDLDQNVFGIGLGVFDKHIEVAVVVEDAGVEKFVLHLLA